MDRPCPEDKQAAAVHVLADQRLNQALLESLPHPALIVGRDRIILAANRAARGMGARVGTHCWDSYGQRASITDHEREHWEAHGTPPPGGIRCTFCLADKALEEQRPRQVELDLGEVVLDTWWVPLDEANYLHYAIDVTSQRATPRGSDDVDWLERAQELAHLGIWDQDPASESLWWSDETYRIFGLPPRSRPMDFHALLDLVHPDDRDRLVRQTELALENPAHTYQCEYRIQRPDGSQRIVFEEALVRRDLEGRPQRITGIIQDITERKLAEEALRASEEKYRLVMDATDDGIWDWRIPDNQVSYSQGWKKILSLDEVPDHYDTWASRLHPEDRAAVMESLTEHLEGRSRHWENEHRLRTAEGEWKWVLGRGKVVDRSPDGSPLRMVGTMVDIARRKEAEEARRESEDRLQRLTALSPAGIYQTGAQGNCVYANQAWLRMAGMTLEEALGRGWSGGLHPEDRVGVFRDWHQMVASQGRWGREYRFQTPDGRVTWVYGLATPIHDSQGQVTGYLGLNVDISERRRAESDLLESETRYRQMFEESPVALLMQDYSQTKACIDALVAEGVEDLRGHLEANPGLLLELLAKIKYLFVNQATLDLYEAEEAEFMASTIADLSPPEVSRHFIDQLLVLCQGQGHYSGTGRNLTLRGTPKEVLVTKVVVAGHEQDLSRVLVTILDLTEAKAAQREKEMVESQLRQAQKMEAVGTLAGGIAHDFNNILATIIGYSELAQDSLQEGDDADEEIAKIIMAADRARELVNKILAFSRKTNFEFKPLDLNHLIAETVQMIERTIPRMITIELDLEPYLRPINGDPNQIEQVLLNLASNAQDAMPNGGILTIDTSQVYLEEDFTATQLEAEPGYYVVMSVSDTGLGMDKEELGRIFEPFYTTKEVGKGTGLGLASVYGIVKSHGGYITCYSEPGAGTNFKIHWPVLETYREPLCEAGLEDDPIPAGSETILLADDEDGIRAIGARLLDRVGYRVHTVASGEEALAAFRQGGGTFDLVILDISMPGMGGLRCLMELLRQDPAAKVVIASGYSRDGQIQASLEAGALGYIAKPFHKSELLRKVREVLDA